MHTQTGPFIQNLVNCHFALCRHID